MQNVTLIHIFIYFIMFMFEKLSRNKIPQHVCLNDMRVNTYLFMLVIRKISIHIFQRRVLTCKYEIKITSHLLGFVKIMNRSVIYLQIATTKNTRNFNIFDIFGVFIRCVVQ